MSGQTVSKQFIFNEKIDAESLFSLYADDFSYMEEIFLTTLRHLDHDVEAIKLAYADADVADLKRAVHKIKPTFGFVGLMSVESSCRDFEQLCEHASTTEEIAAEYKEICSKLLDAKEIMEAEHKRLKEYNANPI
jgi:chemotaxis protein histidine kinase CheA